MATAYLLDTPVVLWWLAGTDMSTEAEHVIGDAANTVYLSSASAWGYR
jgi:PIN domain nuclease of toxin-antitoxin system